MLGTHDLGLFITTGLVLNLTPGVDMLYTISRTAQGGWRSGLAAAAGICAGCVVHTLAAALGLAALLSTSPLAFNAVKWVGAAYLLWLGAGMLRTAWRGAPAVAALALAPASTARVFRQGFVTNVLNPKVALFFMALLPQFIDTAAPHKTAAFLFLGAVFIVNGFAFLCVLVALVARLRTLRASARAARVLQAAGGTLFVALAARLAAAR